MSLVSAISEYPVDWSHGEVLSALRERTVARYGVLAGARLQGILVGLRLMPLISVTAAAPETETPNDNLFQGICIGLMSRFEPDGEIDFGDTDNLDLLDGFLTNGNVLTRLTAIGMFAADVKALILSKCTIVEPEYPNVMLKEVIAVREPALLVGATSSPVVSNGNRVFAVTIGDIPEPVTPMIEIRHHVPVDQETEVDTEWRGAGLAGFGNVGTGVYRIVLPLDWVSPKFSIRVTIPYAAFVSIEIV